MIANIIIVLITIIILIIIIKACLLPNINMMSFLS